MTSGRPSAETALVQQFQPAPDALRERPGAASRNDGNDEHLVRVDQPGREGVGGEPGVAVRV
ncbi:hypothetical protein ACNJ7E_36055 [Rhodococcus sp. NM-2]|uniref:hypothetical protein n=1 Tax=Rhodococcus sp. NM-2 TaxID=3401174 RepID=UPI003AAF40D8